MNSQDRNTALPSSQIDSVVNELLDLDAAGDAQATRALLAHAARETPESVPEFLALRDALATLRAPASTPDLTGRVLGRIYAADAAQDAPDDARSLPMHAAVGVAQRCRTALRRIPAVLAACVVGAVVTGVLVWQHTGPMIPTLPRAAPQNSAGRDLATREFVRNSTENLSAPMNDRALTSDFAGTLRLGALSEYDRVLHDGASPIGGATERDYLTIDSLVAGLPPTTRGHDPAVLCRVDMSMGMRCGSQPLNTPPVLTGTLLQPNPLAPWRLDAGIR